MHHNLLLLYGIYILLKEKSSIPMAARLRIATLGDRTLLGGNVTDITHQSWARDNFLASRQRQRVNVIELQ